MTHPTVDVIVNLMADWLYAEAGNVALPDPHLCEKVETKAIHPAIIAFQSNAGRMRAFWAMNPHLVEVAAINVVQVTETIFHFTGRPTLTKEQHEDQALCKKIADEVRRRVDERFKESGSMEHATGYNFARAVSSFGQLIGNSPDMGEAIYATFSAQLTSAWTAVETLVSDLWEQSLNEHPRSLARLAGKRNRISKVAGALERDRTENGDLPNEEFEPRLRDFERITYGTYDASELMGTLLREQFKFQTLAGIRSAYSAAFSKSNAALDALLADHAWDKLNLVRNLLLHKAGIVDDKFLKGIASLNWAILAEEEKPLPITGQLVKELISPVFQSAEKVILAVDDWIAPKSPVPDEE